MKILLCITMLVFMLQGVAALNASGGDYAVPLFNNELQGGIANNANYSATTGLSDSPAILAHGDRYVAAIGPWVVPPSCSDGIRNRDETGIDCGGVCVASHGAYWYNDACHLTPQSNTGGGGGGGGSVPLADQGAVASSSRRWTDVANNTVVRLEVDLSNISFTAIELRTTSVIAVLDIIVRSYDAAIPKNISTMKVPVYQYIEVSHSELVGLADEYSITFRVDKSWVKANGDNPSKVRVYRLENDVWVPYTPVLKNNDSLYYVYSASVPGFSLFAVAMGREVILSDAVVIQSTNITPFEAIVPPNVSSNAATMPTDGEDASSQKSAEMHSIMLWVSILIVVIALVVGIQLFSRKNSSAMAPSQIASTQNVSTSLQYTSLSSVPCSIVSAQTPSAAAPKNDTPVFVSSDGASISEKLPIHELQNPNLKNIKSATDAEWVVAIDRLCAFVARARLHGHGDDEIKSRLVTAGWKEEVIDDVLSKRS